MHYLKKSASQKGIRKGFLFCFLENDATS
ncbi:Uncharacterized protein BC10311_06341 [Bacillus wiedmannii]|uniref:Uncharacterized protein n=1 Tax=Bacillus wiedmannii TaxID=1890302 RepID=A0AB37Z1X4_9BACI|nr:Uncharacterized protein BC10311_06341 [Bacillus wiedmannii]